MIIKASVVLLFGLVFASVHLAEAQQQGKIPKIGWLGTRSVARSTVSTPGRELFQREFRKLGYVEGKNIASSIDPLILITTGFPPWLKSWSVSRWM